MMTWDGPEGGGLVLDTWGDHPAEGRRLGGRHRRARKAARHAAGGGGGCLMLVLIVLWVAVGAAVGVFLVWAALGGGQP